MNLIQSLTELYINNLTSSDLNNKNQELYFQDEPEQSQLQHYLFSELFIDLPTSQHKVYALIDTGSAISLFRESLLNQLFTPEEIAQYKQPAGVKIHSFTHHPVHIAFDFVIPFRFSKNSNHVYITFRIFRDTPNYPILLGQDAMRVLNLEVSYRFKSVKISYPLSTFLPTIEAPVSAAFTASAYITLNPKETKNIIFYPHPISYIPQHTTVLIEQSSIPKIHVFPTRYTSYSSPNIPYIACISNLSDEIIKGTLHTKITLLENYSFLNRFSKKQEFENIQTPPSPVLHFLYNDHNLPSFDLQEKLPTQNINGKQTVNAYLLKTPHQSIHLQPEPVNTECTKPPAEEDPRLMKFKATLNSMPVPSDDRPNSPPLEIPEGYLKPSGYEIPDNLQPSVSELLQLERFDERHRPYLEDIFINKYPTVVALHSYDIGKISETLGYYTIKLKDNETLPTFRKVYFLNSQDSQQMLDITNFLIKFDIIERCSHRDKISHLMASPGYLVERSNKLASPRLVIDYTLINQVIKTTPPTIPSITAVLQSLRNKAIFSSIDLTSAYYSIQLHPDCRHLTRFATQIGSFTFKSLAMGLSLSPSCFAEIAHRMIHMVPKLNPDGQPIYLEENVIDMLHDEIPGVYIFYDDVLMCSEMENTYEETIKKHYKVVEKVMERLAFHKAKLSLEKSEFGKFSLKFLGWIISNNLLLPDPARTKKLLATQFPSNLKAMRSFLGLLNTLRTVLPHNFLNEMNVLNPLTSSSTPYKPSQIHYEAFDKLKYLLTSQPVYSNIIDPDLDKILFVDASAKGSYSAVLGQVVPPSKDRTEIPPHLLLDDPVDQIIFKHRLCFEPVPLYLHEEFIPRSKLEPPYSIPPFKDPSYLTKEFLGYTEKTAQNTLFFAIRSVQFAYGNTLLTFSQIKEFFKTKFHKHIIKIKLLNDFDQDQNKLKKFLQPIQNDILPVDTHLHMVAFIAQLLSRPIHVISALPAHKNQQIYKFENNIQKPPIILGLHIKQDNLLFMPYYVNKQSSFQLSEIKDRFQIVTFLSKTISPKDYDKDIMQKELFGLMSSLAALKPLIGQSNLLVLTDSKPLFLLYSNPVTQSSSKLCRWGLKLSSEYHNLKLRFISTKNNLADFLTRNFNIKPPDLIRIPIPNIKLPDLDKLIDPDKTFTVPEWQEFVKNHQHLVEIQTHQKSVSVNLISKVKNMDTILDPLRHLHARMAHENIAKEQQREFKNIINFLITQPNMEASKLDKTFLLKDGLLYSRHKTGMIQLLLPESLEGIFLAFTHLSRNHLNLPGMQAALQHLDFPRKLKKIKHLCERCYACALQNLKTSKYTSGSYPTPDFPFQYIHLDLIENLPPNQGFAHVLVVVCPLSKFLLCFPLKNKQTHLILYNFLNSIYQFVNVQFVISDNGPAFASTDFLTTLTALNIKKIRIASLKPTSNGLAESYVKKVKTALKKTLTTCEEYQWLDVLPILVKHFNSTPRPDTKLSPLQILHGETSIMAEKGLTDRPTTKLYPLFENIRTQVETKQEETRKILEFIRSENHWKKINDHEKINKNKHPPNFALGDICFVKDRAIVPGSTRPLKSLYSPDPWVILQLKPTTALLKRLADGYSTIYSYEDLKKYSRLDPSFSTLPPPVRDVLIHNFQELNKLHYDQLREHALLPLPNSIKLFDLDDQEETHPLKASDTPPSQETTNPDTSEDDIPTVHDILPEPKANPKPLKNVVKNEEFTRITRSKTLNTPLSDSDSEEENDTKKVNFQID